MIHDLSRAKETPLTCTSPGVLRWSLLGESRIFRIANAMVIVRLIYNHSGRNDGQDGRPPIDARPIRSLRPIPSDGAVLIAAVQKRNLVYVCHQNECPRAIYSGQQSPRGAQESDHCFCGRQTRSEMEIDVSDLPRLPRANFYHPPSMQPRVPTPPRQQRRRRRVIRNSYE